LPRVRKKRIIEVLFMHALLALHFFPKLVAFTPYPSQHDLRPIGLVGVSIAEEHKLRVEDERKEVKAGERRYQSR
jgi:hypothetical protein